MKTTRTFQEVRQRMWVILSIPVSLLLLVLIPGLGGDKVLPALIAGVAAFATYAGVRAYYARGPLGDEDTG